MGSSESQSRWRYARRWNEGHKLKNPTAHQNKRVTMHRFSSEQLDGYGLGSLQAQPETELEAVMQAAPHEEPAMSSERLQPLLDVVRDVMEEVLNEREYWILSAYFWRGMSYDKIAVELNMSKTHCHRLGHQGMEKMRNRMVDMEDDTVGLLRNLGFLEPEALVTEEREFRSAWT